MGQIIRKEMTMTIHISHVIALNNANWIKLHMVTTFLSFWI